MRWTDLTADELLASLERGLEAAGRALIVLGSGDDVLFATALAEHWLAVYFYRAAFGRGLPDALVSWLGTHRAASGQAPQERPSTPLVLTRGERRLVIELLPEAHGGRRLLLLRKQRASCAPAGAIAQRGLTPRQLEVLGWAAEGQTNREIALRLSVSPRTVQKHLRLIYQRLGVTTRTAAVRRLLER